MGPGGTAFFLASEKAGFSRRYTSRTGLRRTRDGSHGRALQGLVSLLLLLVADLWIAYAAKGDKPNSTRWAPFAAASIVGGVHDDLYQRSGSWARRRTFPRPRRTTGVRAFRHWLVVTRSNSPTTLELLETLLCWCCFAPLVPWFNFGWQTAEHPQFGPPST